MTRAHSDQPGGPPATVSGSTWAVREAPSGWRATTQGVSFASVHQRSTSTTITVISTWSEGAWPIITLLDARLDP